MLLSCLMPELNARTCVCVCVCVCVCGTQADKLVDFDAALTHATQPPPTVSTLETPTAPTAMSHERVKAYGGPARIKLPLRVVVVWDTQGRAPVGTAALMEQVCVCVCVCVCQLHLLCACLCL